jgi:DNA polymerase-3 subunit beta
MQIQLERETLLTPVSMVAGIVERRQTLPILSYLLVRAETGNIVLAGTDMEVELVVTVTGDVVTPGAATVPARKLFDICRALAEGTVVKMGMEGGRVVLRGGKSRFALATLPVGDFPKIETTGFERVLSVQARKLRTMLEATAFCMAQQDVRYYLNGLYLEVDKGSIRAVATDGHRMAIAVDSSGGQSEKAVQIIVPRKAIQEILRLVPTTEELVHVDLSTNHMRLELDGAIFTSKLIDGKFPDYTKVIPTTQSKRVTLDRQGFRESLGRVAILANEKYRGVRLNLEDSRLRITAHNPEQEEAVEELETEYSGEALEIGFNVNYLIDAVNAIETKDVVLGLNDSSSSCTLRSADERETQYIIMPMRL